VLLVSTPTQPHDELSQSRDAERVVEATTGDDLWVAYIEATIAAIPPLTADERERIGAILQGGGGRA
jgi:hypothetical protein